MYSSTIVSYLWYLSFSARCPRQYAFHVHLHSQESVSSSNNLSNVMLWRANSRLSERLRPCRNIRSTGAHRLSLAGMCTADR